MDFHGWFGLFVRDPLVVACVSVYPLLLLRVLYVRRGWFSRELRGLKFLYWQLRHSYRAHMGIAFAQWVGMTTRMAMTEVARLYREGSLR